LGTGGGLHPCLKLERELGSVKYLQIFILKITSNITQIRGLYALRVLRSHGLSDISLHGVAKATVVARLLYSAPVWWGFPRAEDRNKLEQFLNRTRQMDYLPGDSPVVSEMVREAEDKLLSAVSSSQFHVLHRLFSPTIERKYFLRPREHDSDLLPKDDKNFIHRMLYSILLNR